MAKKSNRGKSRGGRTNQWQRIAAARLRGEEVVKPVKAAMHPTDIDWCKTERKCKHADPDWRLRKVLRALADGWRLTFDKARRTWLAFNEWGIKFKIKRGLMLELLRCKFINLRLALTSWGQYAAGAAL